MADQVCVANRVAARTSVQKALDETPPRSRGIMQAAQAVLNQNVNRCKMKSLTDSDDPLPMAGRIDVALDWHGAPALLLRTVEVTVRRFCDVDEDFALAEGENRDLDGWRSDHQRYFERNGGWFAEMELVFERFVVIEHLS